MELAKEMSATEPFPRGKVVPFGLFRRGGPAPAARPEETADDEEGLVALVRNPRSLYVYWDPGDKAERRVRSMLGDDEWQRTIPCLRIFDVTSGPYPAMPTGPVLMIDLNEGDDYAFINQGLQPGRRYVICLERRTPEGRHYMIHHTEPVSMPHDRPEKESALYRMYGRQPDHWSGSPWR